MEHVQEQGEAAQRDAPPERTCNILRKLQYCQHQNEVDTQEGQIEGYWQPTLPPIFFRLASSWSMMPTLVVRMIFPNCKDT